MSKAMTTIRSINKWQLIIILAAGGTIGWLLMQAYVLKTCQLGTMCAAHDPTLWLRIGIIALCAIFACWLVRSGKMTDKSTPTPQS